MIGPEALAVILTLHGSVGLLVGWCYEEWRGGRW